MKYEIEVQALYYDGWECVFTAANLKEAREILADYRANDREVPYRIHKVRAGVNA